MTTAITAKNRFRIEDRAPIGTRYTDGEDTYTLVAYSVDPQPRSARPLLIADTDLDAKPLTHWYDRATKGSIEVLDISDVLAAGETLQPAEPDTEKADAARAAFAGRTEPTFRDMSYFSHVTLHADLADDEVSAFLAYATAELELRIAQRELERAAQARAERIALMVRLKGSQSEAARTLGLNQSTVSRAVRDVPERP